MMYMNISNILMIIGMILVIAFMFIICANYSYGFSLKWWDVVLGSIGVICFIVGDKVYK